MEYNLLEVSNYRPSDNLQVFGKFEELHATLGIWVFPKLKLISNLLISFSFGKTQFTIDRQQWGWQQELLRGRIFGFFLKLNFTGMARQIRLISQIRQGSQTP